MTQTPVASFDLATMTAPARAVEQYLEEYLRHRPLPTNLRDAVEYALLGGGKRLRPLLVVRSCEAVGGTLKQSLPAAAAIEMVHAFSLAHDDLPAMDDDDLRRGRPTLHVHTNEAMAILAGDALMSLAFEIVTTRVHDTALCGAICRELSVGTSDMVAGQVYDTMPEFEKDLPPVERLRTIHRHKTGALLRSACRMGALAGGASASQISDLSDYADAIGLMFQIVDDLLDATATTEQLGKAARKDEQQGKLTYPGLLGIEDSREQVRRLRLEAQNALASLGPEADALRELCDYMAVRDS